MPTPTGSALMERLVALCRRRGFIFQSSEIYGGINGFWDYGPLGVELKNNVKAAWWRQMVQLRDDMVGLDAAIIMNPRVWEASGHVAGFSDPMVDCRNCKLRFRAEDLKGPPSEIACPNCGNRGTLTEARQFNLMFSTHVGPVEESASVAYLRPETAQGIFVNFANVATTARKKLPFGIAQIGKSFRNEITPGNFIFRDREFEQMEMEFFVHPSEADLWYRYWRETRYDWWCSLGLAGKNLRLRDHEQDELAHYAKDSGGCCDVEYAFPFSGEKGFTELEGIAYRSDFDLRQHQRVSGVKLEYFDPERNERYLPHVVEPAAGLTRGVLAILCEAYTVDESRPSPELMRFHPRLAPIKAGVFPLVNKEGMPEIAERIYQDLRARVGPCQYDAKQSIGKRYARMDEAGTPFCITVDGQTLTDQAVTVRDRDTGGQVRVATDQVVGWVAERVA